MSLSDTFQQTFPTFSEARIKGFLGPSISFRVQGEEGTQPNPAALAFLKERFSDPPVPEFDVEQTAPLQGRARLLLDAVFSFLVECDWPVFQRGVFEPDGDSDLIGTFHLPTRLERALLPGRFFNLLLDELHSPAAHTWSQAEFDQRAKPLLVTIKRAGLHGANRRLVLLGAHRRRVAVTELSDDIVQFGEGPDARFVRGSVSDATGLLGMVLQTSKVMTTDIFKNVGIPTVTQHKVSSLEQALEAARAIGYPVVLKPYNEAMARGVVCDICTEEFLIETINNWEYSINDAVIEGYIPGDNARITISKGQVIEVRHILLATVIGDGQRRVAELLDEFLENNNDLRPIPEPITVSEFIERNSTIGALANQGLTLDSILEEGRTCRLQPRPASRQGSIVHNLDPSELAPSVHETALRAAEIMGLDAAGVDVLDFRPDRFGYMNEINAGPGMDRFESVLNRYVDDIVGTAMASDALG